MTPSNGTNIATLTTTVVKSGSGILRRITVNKTGTTDTATVYDNTSAAGTILATINCSSAHRTLEYGIRFQTGLTVVTAGSAASDITVVWE